MFTCPPTEAKNYPASLGKTCGQLNLPAFQTRITATNSSERWVGTDPIYYPKTPPSTGIEPAPNVLQEMTTNETSLYYSLGFVGEVFSFK